MSTRPPAGPSRLRASNAERDHVVEVIRSHWHAGRLTDAELEQRVGRALQARTLGQLRTLVDDLPGPPAPPQRRAQATAGYARRTATGVLKPAAMLAGAVFATLLLIGVVAVDDEGRDGSASAPEVSAVRGDPYTPPEERISRVASGRSGRDAGLSFRLVKVRALEAVPLRTDRGSEGGLRRAAGGSQFLVATVDATNGTNKSVDPFCGDYGAKLYTRDGRGYEPVDENYKIAGNEGVCGGDPLPPDQRESYELVFEVPDGARPREVDVWFSAEEDDTSGNTRLRFKA